MALKGHQKKLYQDRVSVFRLDPRDADDQGDVATYRLVRGSQNQPCKHFTTENYDERSSPAGQVKTQNIMTSDVVRADFTLDVRAEDVARMEAGPEAGSYFTVAGAPLRRNQLASFTEFYLVPAPGVDSTKISDLYWGE
jgi:hypothetical protein